MDAVAPFAGPVLDVPHDVTPSQLQALLNGLVKEDGSCMYTFFVQGQELGCDLGMHLVKHKVRLPPPLCLFINY
jgi:ribosome assembly protein 4